MDSARESLVSSSGGLLLARTVRVSGLARALSVALAPWRGRRAVHDPGKVICDLVTAVALGGDCLADLGVVRAQPGLFGAVASDPTVSRLIATLAGDVEVSLAAIRAAHAAARSAAWAARRPLPARAGSGEGGQVTVDIDSTLVTAHSDKEHAGPTYKRGFGFAPMCAFVDHGEHGTGETLSLQLRPGPASPFNVADHIDALDLALAQLPEHERAQVLVRADSGACSKKFLHHVTDAGLEYSIGYSATATVKAAVEAIPAQAWRSALDGDGQAREGAQVAELTAWMPTPTIKPSRPGPQNWPAGMRVIARRERPHPGAQLRLTDADGWRVTCFATNTKGPGWTLPVLEIRHRQRARAEDRIRCLKDTGMANLPFAGYDRNQIWLAIVALAADLLTWTQTLAWPDQPPNQPQVRRWEPKRFRLRLLSVAGAHHRHRPATTPATASRDWPWNPLIDTGWATLNTT
ncbi:IS1380 family transposase [Actinopolymorpha sp. NPDC004070]|uniref:IS1380 family transposase n=1 Tax=Actinopolymorpha sp. NPDC004070 TaxID=3154548 RepID=UPI0033BB6D77